MKLILQEKVTEALNKFLDEEEFEAFFSGLLEITSQKSKHLAMFSSLKYNYENNNIKQVGFGSFKAQCQTLLIGIFASDFDKVNEVSLRIKGKWYSTEENWGTPEEKLLGKTTVKQISLTQHGFVEIIFLNNVKKIIGNEPFEMNEETIYVRKK